MCLYIKGQKQHKLLEKYRKKKQLVGYKALTINSIFISSKTPAYPPCFGKEYRLGRVARSNRARAKLTQEEQVTGMVCRGLHFFFSKKAAKRWGTNTIGTFKIQTKDLVAIGENSKKCGRQFVAMRAVPIKFERNDESRY